MALSRFVTVVALLFLAQPAVAVLLEVDLATAGDALITRDTDSGLDWLDIDQTAGLSYDAVVGGAGGWAAMEWRHATTEEVCGLVGALGTNLSPCPGGAGGLPAPDAVPAFFSYLGSTIIRPIPPGEFEVFAAGIFDDGDPGLLGVLFVSQLFPFQDGSLVLEENVDRGYPFGAVDGSTSDPTLGHLLVRRLPEPSLAMLGLAGAALLARGSPRSKRR